MWQALSPGGPSASRTIQPQFSVYISPGLESCPWSLSLHSLSFQLPGAVGAPRVVLRFCLCVGLKSLSPSSLSQSLAGRRATPRVISLFPGPEFLAPEQLVSSWRLGGAERSRQRTNQGQGDRKGTGCQLESSAGEGGGVKLKGP